METLALQYLKDSPDVATIAPGDARSRLRAALDLLPISHVLLGWNLSSAVVDACREETVRAGAQLFRWHPLLTGDGTFVPRPQWQTVGPDGNPVAGSQGLPEFTFVCPNRPAVREAVLSRLRDAIRGGNYEGVFLDRIRYPSPAADPARLLACFCNDCRLAALAEELDLEAVRRCIEALLVTPDRIPAFLRTLLDPQAPETPGPDPSLAALCSFLDFRARSVTRLVKAAAELIHAEGLQVGLDCFSPVLTHMVGQDLGALAPHGEWIKIMSYGHALGPAGLPFELLGLADWLVTQLSISEPEALEWLSLATRLPLPPTCTVLREKGLTPDALAVEVRRGRAAGASTLLAGIELVEVEGVTHLHPAQIAADLNALRAAGANGLVLSWDLWHIPLEHLDLVRHRLEFAGPESP
jgi:hypothetical protein